MIRRSIGMLIAFMLVVCISSFAFARGTPQKAFASKAAVVQVSPIVATVPAQVGYDVIRNISPGEPRDLFIAQFAVSDFAYTRNEEQGTTGDERIANRESNGGFGRLAPCIVMLA